MDLRLILTPLFGVLMPPLPMRAPEAPTDLQLLQGTWKVISIRSGEKDLGKEYLGTTVRFADNTLSWYKNGELDMGAEIRLDPKPRPRHIDIRTVKPSRGNPDLPGLGLYELVKDRLTMCYCYDQEAPRPKTLTTEGGRPHILVVLERVKE